MKNYATSAPTAPRIGHPGRNTVLAVVGGLGVAGATLLVLSIPDGGGSSPPIVEPASAVAVPAPGFRPAAPPPSTLYLVGSEEEAIFLRAAQQEADVIRVTTGERAFNDTVVVVGSDADAELVRAGIRDAEAISLAVGEPPFEQSVVDRRVK